MIQYKKDLILWEGKPMGFTEQIEPGVRYLHMRDNSRFIHYEGLGQVLSLEHQSLRSVDEFRLHMTEIDEAESFLCKGNHREYSRYIIPQGKVLRESKTRSRTDVPRYLDEMDGSVYYDNQAKFFVEDLTFHPYINSKGEDHGTSNF